EKATEQGAISRSGYAFSKETIQIVRQSACRLRPHLESPSVLSRLQKITPGTHPSGSIDPQKNSKERWTRKHRSGANRYCHHGAGESSIIPQLRFLGGINSWLTEFTPAYSLCDPIQPMCLFFTRIQSWCESRRIIEEEENLGKCQYRSLASDSEPCYTLRQSDPIDLFEVWRGARTPQATRRLPARPIIGARPIRRRAVISSRLDAAQKSCARECVQSDS